MLIRHDREKLINAMIFFVTNTKQCHKLKLFKLLYLLDFEHYRQSGRPVTNESYRAWKMGPVPARLFHELKEPAPDMATALGVTVTRRAPGTGEARYSYSLDNPPPEVDDERVLANWSRSDFGRTVFHPRHPFESRYFTKRELSIMKVIAEIFQEARGEDMSEFSHIKGSPWRKVFKKGEGSGHAIPYDLALESDPIVSDAPTIDAEELAYRREALKEVTRPIGK